MKKTLHFIMIIFISFALIGCEKPNLPSWVPWVNSETDSNAIEYDKVEITISKYGDSNSLQDIDKNYIVAPTSNKTFDIEGLTQNKMVLVRVDFYVSNKTDSEYVFRPWFTISDSRGYKLNKFSKEANIETINDGTTDESIKVTDLSKAIKPNEINKLIRYVFLYECNKNPDPNIRMLYQDWYFYDESNNNKEIHNAVVGLKFPSNYKQIEQPTLVFNDNSIDIISEDRKSVV